MLRQYRTIPALRLKHRSDSCGTSLAVSALRIMRYCPKFLQRLQQFVGDDACIVPRIGPCLISHMFVCTPTFLYRI